MVGLTYDFDSKPKKVATFEKNIDLVLVPPSMCQSHTLLNEVLYIKFFVLTDSLTENQRVAQTVKDRKLKFPHNINEIIS